MQFNMLEAKTNLSKIVKQVETKDVDEIVLARGGKPVAKIVPYEQPPVEMRLGAGKRKYPEVLKDSAVFSFASLTADDDAIAAELIGEHDND